MTTGELIRDARRPRDLRDIADLTGLEESAE
jgi:hypothetical protein